MIIYRSVKIMARRNLTAAEIGEIVRTTRKASGLRQDELAGAAGVGLRFIVDLEAGKPTAQIGKTLQVLAALGCSLDITPPPDVTGARKA
jgi:y4mF family transcriptional regulator